MKLDREKKLMRVMKYIWKRREAAKVLGFLRLQVEYHATWHIVYHIRCGQGPCTNCGELAISILQNAAKRILSDATARQKHGAIQ